MACMCTFLLLFMTRGRAPSWGGVGHFGSGCCVKRINALLFVCLCLFVVAGVAVRADDRWQPDSASLKRWVKAVLMSSCPHVCCCSLSRAPLGLRCFRLSQSAGAGRLTIIHSPMHLCHLLMCAHVVVTVCVCGCVCLCVCSYCMRTCCNTGASVMAKHRQSTSFWIVH